MPKITQGDLKAPATKDESSRVIVFADTYPVSDLDDITFSSAPTGQAELVMDGEHLRRVIYDGVLKARVSVDIATAGSLGVRPLRRFFRFAFFVVVFVFVFVCVFGFVDNYNCVV